MIVNNEVLSVTSLFSYTYGVALSTQIDYYGKLLYFTAKPGQKNLCIFNDFERKRKRTFWLLNKTQGHRHFSVRLTVSLCCYQFSMACMTKPILASNHPINVIRDKKPR